MTQAHLSLNVGKQELELAKARNLAYSGLTDFRSKLARDPKFPPRLGDQSQPLSYSESLTSSSGVDLGRFQVEVLSLRKSAPHRVIQVKSVGIFSDSKFAITGYIEYADGLRWLGFQQEDADWY